MEGMQRDAERTRRQILAAATEEFAERGIAGARVDRIATVAGCNKAMLYAYFGNKDGLFDAVFTASVEHYLEQVGFDAGDLPHYAGRVFDYFEKHPGHLRLTTWYRLERGNTGSVLDVIVESYRHKVAVIEAAQRDGRLSSRWGAAELLVLVLNIAGMWSTMTPEFTALFSTTTREQRRQVVADGVKALLAA